AGCVAGAQRALDMSRQYALERQAFGRSIGHFQVIRHKFADMATKIETARQMVYTTAWRFQNGEYPVREISMAKLYAARIAVEVADECIQIHGGNGYMKEYGVERVWRDMRLNRIGAGTDEIMLEVIEVIGRRVTLPSDVFLLHGTLYTHGATSNTASNVALLVVALLGLFGQLLATGAVFKLQLDAYLGKPHEIRESLEFAFARHR